MDEVLDVLVGWASDKFEDWWNEELSIDDATNCNDDDELADGDDFDLDESDDDIGGRKRTRLERDGDRTAQQQQQIYSDDEEEEEEEEEADNGKTKRQCVRKAQSLLSLLETVEEQQQKEKESVVDDEEDQEKEEEKEDDAGNKNRRNLLSDELLDSIDDGFASTLQWSDVNVRGGLAPSKRCWATACALASKILVSGGYDKVTPYRNDLHVYDVNTGVWKAVAVRPMESGRHAHTMDVVSGSRIVMFGGHSVGGYLNDLYVLDFDAEANSATSRQVEVEGTAPQPRAAPATAVVGDSLYFFGGDSGTDVGYRSDLHVLHTAASPMRWERIEASGDTPEPRGWHTMSAVGTLLYVFGGCDGSTSFNDVHVFDTELGRWSRLEPSGLLPSHRYSHSALVVDSHFIVVLGGDGRQDTSGVHVYNTRANAWVTPSLAGRAPSKRYGQSAVFVPELRRIFAFGGYEPPLLCDAFSCISLDHLPSIRAPADNLGSHLSTLVNQRSFSDIVFVVDADDSDGQGVPTAAAADDASKSLVYAHRAILMARSNYFRAMLTGFAESKQQRITLQGVTRSVMLAVLQFLYANSAPVDADSAVDVMLAAQMWNLPELSRLCEARLERELSLSTAIGLFELADTYHASALRRVVFRFIVTNWPHIFRSDAFTRASPSTRQILLSHVAPRASLTASSSSSSSSSSPASDSLVASLPITTDALLDAVLASNSSSSSSFDFLSDSNDSLVL
jgi:BTB/POZ domain/Kelch motif